MAAPMTVRSAMLLLLLLGVFVLSTSPLHFASAQQQQQPGWCSTTYLYQNQWNYTVCDPVSGPIQEIKHDFVRTWCNTNNRLAREPITFRDPLFKNNCTEPKAHCVAVPFGGLSMELCGFPIFESVERVVSSNASFAQDIISKCKSVNFAYPFDLPTGVLSLSLPHIVLSLQKGIAFLNMYTETVVYQEITEAGNFTKMSVVTSTKEGSAYIIGANNHRVFVWKAKQLFVKQNNSTYFNATLLSNDTLNANVLGLNTFKIVDGTNGEEEMWVALLLEGAAGSINFYRVASDGSTFTVPAFQWSFEHGRPIVGFEVVKHMKPDHNITKDATLQCLSAARERFIVTVYTSQQVYALGFEPSLSGSYPIPLNASQVGKTLLLSNNNSADGWVSAHTFGECLGSYANPSQRLWLVTVPESGANIQWTPLSEFALVDFDCAANDPDWWLHPASNKRDSKTGHCIVTYNSTCQPQLQYVDDQGRCVENLASSSIDLSDYGIKSVESRMHKSLSLADFSGLFDEVTNFTSWQSKLQNDLIRNVYFTGLKTVKIYGFQELACTFMSLPIISELNTIKTSHEIDSTVISHNGQHMFLSVGRQKWELLSRIRFTEVCNQTMNDPNFLLRNQTMKACEQLTPRYFDVFDYVEYYSECNKGWFCGTYSHENPLFDFKVAKGFHNIRPTSQYYCEPGFFCPMAGIRFPCLVGYKCPSAGMLLPVPCEIGSKYDTACLQQSLESETPCPPGSICTDTTTPIPASPGLFVLDSDRTTMYQCVPGQYCPLGSHLTDSKYKAHDYSDITCPAYTYCSAPDVMVPVACTYEYDQDFKKTGYNETEYCPAGTTVANDCPPGFSCITPNMIRPCKLGEYCPAGTQFPQVCPERYYCPTPAQKILCPRGYFCREASVEPKKCHLLVYCAEGSKSEMFAFGGIAVDILIIAIVLVGLKLYPYLRGKLRQRHHLKRKKKEKQISSEALQLENAIPMQDTMVPTPTAATKTHYRHQSEKKDFTVDFTFENMGLVLRSNGQSVLSGVTGEIKHGRLTAVMGPSGAGKTTFLTTLAGKAHYGYRTGIVRINGDPSLSVDDLKKITGFVPQEDIMHHDLTVRENLEFSAETRLPKSWTREQRRMKVSRVIEALGLYDIRHSLIGDESKRGISGGQRKRVNIGLELCADPTILFLDEPTSGLDSTSSQEVIASLRKYAEDGLTVVTVIHQPRYEIFTLFHDVLLLGNGGRTVYIGPSEKALPYFEYLGFKLPPHVNPADFLMDVISGMIPRAGHPEFQSSDLFDLWIENKDHPERWWVHSNSNSNSSSSSGNKEQEQEQEQEQNERGVHIDVMPVAAIAAPFPTSQDDNNDSDDTEDSDTAPLLSKPSVADAQQINAAGDTEDNDNVLSINANKKKFTTIMTTNKSNKKNKKQKAPPITERETINSFHQMLLFTHRALVQQVRDLRGVLVELFLVLIPGILMGAINSNIIYRGPISKELADKECFPHLPESQRAVCYLPKIDTVYRCALLTTTAISICAVTLAMRWFGREKVVFAREASTGISKLAYFIGKNIAHLPMLLLSTLYFTTIWYTLTSPMARFYEFYLFFFVVFFCFYGYGYMFSILINHVLGGVVYAVVASIMCGNNPSLAEIKKRPSLLPTILIGFSPGRWFFEGLYLVEIRHYRGLQDIETALRRYGFTHPEDRIDSHGIPMAYGMLVLHGVVSRLLTFVLIVLNDPEHKAKILGRIAGIPMAIKKNAFHCILRRRRSTTTRSAMQQESYKNK